MQTSQKGPCRHFLNDVGHAGMSSERRGDVVKREAYSGHNLRKQNEEKRGPEYIREASATRDGFIQRVTEYLVRSGALVYPFPQTPEDTGSSEGLVWIRVGPSRGMFAVQLMTSL